MISTALDLLKEKGLISSGQPVVIQGTACKGNCWRIPLSSCAWNNGLHLSYRAGDGRVAPSAPLRELLLDADPDERRIADHLAHGELYVAKTAGLPPESLLSVRRGTYMGNHELLRSS